MKINYPIKKTQEKKLISVSNRGMNLEGIINESNQYYLDNDIAVIYKKPTPVQIVKVNYPQRSKAVITEAYYKTPSTTDYNGIYKGRYIDFEAKESNSKTSFPLASIHPHQINHLKNIIKHGGVGFIIFYFSMYDEFYVLKMDVILRFWDHQDERKSIPYDVFVKEGFKLKEGFLPRLDYLKALDYIEKAI